MLTLLYVPPDDLMPQQSLQGGEGRGAGGPRSTHDGADIANLNCLSFALLC